MSVRRRLAATAIATAMGVGFTTIPAASALAKPAPPAARPASTAQHAKPAPSSPAAPPAPLTMTQVVSDLMEVLNNHPEAFTPLLNVPARQLFGSFGYVTAVNPTNHTVTVAEQIGFPHRHPNVVTVGAGPAILLRNNTAATLANVRIGVAGSRHGSQYTALTMIVHGPA